MKPSVAFMPAGLDACALYRLFLVHLHLENSVFLFSPFGMPLDKFAHCQVVMVQRLSSQQNYEALNLFKKMNMKIVYDLDDDLWSVPSYNPAYHLLKQWLPGFSICAGMADMITVSTAHLKLAVQRALGKHCPPIEVVENALDFKLFRPVPQQYRRAKNGAVVLGWAGSNTHSGDTKEVFELVPQLMREFPQVEFELAGEKLPEPWVKEFGERVRQRDFVPVAEFGAHWASWQWDIALAPLEKNTFNLSKSNIKMIEAAALKIPCVASNIGEYGKFCADSPLLRKSVLADSIRTWRQRLSHLIVDEKFRQQVGEKMYEIGKEHFDIRRRMDRWDEVFSEVVG